MERAVVEQALSGSEERGAAKIPQSGDRKGMAACQLAYAQCNKTAAFIAADAVDAIVKHYVRLLSRERANRTDQCPRCASRNVRTFFDIAIAPDGAYFEACRECGWDSHPGYPEDSEEAPDEVEVAEAPHD